MTELEERLGVRMMENIGKKDIDYNIVKKTVGQEVFSSTDCGSGTGPMVKLPQGENFADSPASTKKSVRFSEDLDIAVLPQKRDSVINKRPPVAVPISDIVERTAPIQAASLASPTKTSRFKLARAAMTKVIDGRPALPNASLGLSSSPLGADKSSVPKPSSTPIEFIPADQRSRSVPTGPEGLPLASSIVEREVSVSVSAAEPDELDPQLLHQEVATEYHKMRNRMIQRQGGFAKEEETEIVPYTEEEGGPKKMSRFKAARLARS